MKSGLTGIILGLTALAMAGCGATTTDAPPDDTTSTEAPPAQAATPPAASSSAGPSAWVTTTEPFHIIDNIYYVGSEGLGAYLFTTDEGHVLLDGGLQVNGPQIEANITKLGFKLSDVKILLNSHAHLDHSGGLAELKEKSGAQLWAHEGDVSALEGGFYLGSESNTGMGAPPVKVDKVLQDGAVVDLGKMDLTLHHTPGHSRGCSSWGLTASANGENYDVLVFCSATVAANRITPPLQYEGIVEDYRKTFALAKRLNVTIPLAPHPEFFGLLEKRDVMKADPSTNPFIDPQAFPALMARLEADFEKTLAERTAAASAN